MDEDFYIENNSLGKIIFLVILFIAFLCFGYYAYTNYFLKNYVKLKKVTVELGDKISYDIHDYIECRDYDKYKLDVSNVKVNSEGNLVSAGEYSYKITDNQNNVKKGKIFVKDTTKPGVEVNDLTVGVNEEFNVSEFVTACDDYSLPCKVSYKRDSDSSLNKKAGEYNIGIVITDAAGNETSKNVKLTVKEGYSYSEVKQNDFEVSHISNENSNWDKTYTLKFDKALNEDDNLFDTKLKELSAIEYDFDKGVSDREMIIIYNKYNYVIGISIKVTFDDNTVRFVTSENTNVKQTEENPEEVE